MGLGGHGGKVMKDFVIAIAPLVIAVTAIIVTIYLSYKEVRNSNRQLLEQFKRSFFAEYTKRYQEIILAMPNEVFQGTAPIAGETKKYMQLYFDLCSEEYHLHQEGIIPDNVWGYWKDGMILTMSMGLYEKCWKSLKENYNQDFRLFFEHDIVNKGELTNEIKNK